MIFFARYIFSVCATDVYLVAGMINRAYVSYVTT